DLAGLVLTSCGSMQIRSLPLCLLCSYTVACGALGDPGTTGGASTSTGLYGSDTGSNTNASTLTTTTGPTGGVSDSDSASTTPTITDPTWGMSDPDSETGGPDTDGLTTDPGTTT